MASVDSVSSSSSISSSQSSSEVKKHTRSVSRHSKDSISPKKPKHKGILSCCWQKVYEIGKQILVKTKKLFCSLFTKIKAYFIAKKAKKQHVHKKSKSKKSTVVQKKTKKAPKKKSPEKLPQEKTPSGEVDPIKKPSSPILPRTSGQASLPDPTPQKLTPTPTPPPPQPNPTPSSPIVTVQPTETAQGESDWSAFKDFKESSRTLILEIQQNPNYQTNILISVIKEAILDPNSLDLWYEELNLKAWNRSDLNFNGSNSITSYLSTLTLLENNLFVSGELHQDFQQLLNNTQNDQMLYDFAKKVEFVLKTWNQEDLANSLNAKMKNREFVEQMKQVLNTIANKLNT